MYSEPECATVTFSGFGNTDPNGQSYDGMTLKKECNYVNDQITFWYSTNSHYVFYCDKYEDWRLALSNNDRSDCQAFAKTARGSGEEWNTLGNWYEWQSSGWQFSSGTVTCNTTAYNITCGEPIITEGEAQDIGIIITIIMNILVILCVLGCCAFFCMRYFRRRKKMNEERSGIPENPRNPYNPEAVELQYNQDPYAANRHNQPYAANNRNTPSYPRQQREEGETEGYTEGGTAGVTASAPPPVYNSAPPAYNSGPPAYY